MLEKRSYKIAFTLAIILHLILLFFLFRKLAEPSHYAAQVNPNAAIIQAVAIEHISSKAAAPKPIAKIQKQIPKATIKASPKKQPVPIKIKKKSLAKHVMVKKIKPGQRPQYKQTKKTHQVIKKQDERVLQTKLKNETQKIAKAKQKTALQKELTSELAQEKQQLAAQTAARQMQGVLDKYKALILEAIRVNWIVPEGVAKNATCLLLTDVAPGGVVLDVKLMQSSGNAVLDRSAKTAVLKAAPLPVPKDPALFDNFREIKLIVRPQGIGAE